MRPDRVPSPRVKLSPWYFPVRNKRPSRFSILKRVLKDQCS